MTHKRKEIKKAIKALVITAVDGIVLAENVKIQAAMPQLDAKLPAVHINIRTEDTPLFETSPRELNRHAELTVELFGKANDGETLDDFLDDIGLLIENKLGEGDNENLSGLVDDIILIKTEVDADYNGKHAMGAIRMTFTVQTVLPTNTVLEADDLEEILAKWKISESDPDNATDSIDLT